MPRKYTKFVVYVIVFALLLSTLIMGVGFIF